jgi:hypothetical protein
MRSPAWVRIEPIYHAALVEGETLADRLARGRLALGDALAIARRAARS